VNKSELAAKEEGTTGGEGRGGKKKSRQEK